MRRRLIPLAFLALTAGCGGGTHGPVNAACLGAGRSAATAASCGCVQRVAHRSLGWGEQRRAARFFKDPDRAEATRMSDAPADKTFWKRYEAFIDRAKASCQG
ncbi:arginine transporter [Frigidibacter sp. MR17.14]|uniref:arginine transporter n=1 Tax=Frigidibacter sp. MR17.14 TaxID=3126509 RepID=UPI0030130EE0